MPDWLLIAGWLLVIAAAAALGWLAGQRHCPTCARDRREADHAATLPDAPPPAAVAALTPDALPDGAAPIVPGPPADPGPAIAAAIEHLASAIAAERMGCPPHIADQWTARAIRALHRLDADQLRDALLIELDAAATCRADELVPATPQES
ncbi:hypothetical protein ACFHW1_05130 [Micromonospora sp. LOL_014]|uniref:hypothetical protein n=1 Tax=Micromonospora sp. LOL_014 TaxID=3345415 RepID=UPI003A86FEA1